MPRFYLDCVPNISAEDFERFAQESAKTHGYDVTAIGFHYNRHAFGSLSINWEAAHMRRLYRRAQEIAVEHQKAEAA